MKHRVLLALCLAAVACDRGSRDPAEPLERPLIIGLSLDTLKEERWQRDRDMFARAEELGAKVLVQAANGNEGAEAGREHADAGRRRPDRRAAQRETRRPSSRPRSSVPVIVRPADPQQPTSTSTLLDPQGRRDAGRVRAEHEPKGNYVLIGGSPTDNNAQLFSKARTTSCGPPSSAATSRSCSSSGPQEWRPTRRQEDRERASPKPGTHRRRRGLERRHRRRRHPGARRAGARRQGARHRPGRRLAACQRIVAGTPDDDRLQADRAARRRRRRARGQARARSKPVVEPTAGRTTARSDVPSVLLEPIAVDKENLDATVIKDGYHKREDVYKGRRDSSRG